MTVNATEIETVLGPLRGFDSDRTRMLSLSSIGGPHIWTETMEPPVSDWLGNIDGGPSDVETLQQMRIAVFVAFMDRVPVLADEHPWCLLDHQAAGYRCAHRRFLGRRVLLKPHIYYGCVDIAKSEYGQNMGCWADPSLSELLKYRSQLQKMGLDCDKPSTFKYLMEGFYPIDLTQSVMDQICVSPFSLDSLLGSPRPLGSIEHYAILAFIAGNSD